MKKYVVVLLMLCVMFIGIGPVSAFNFQTGTFGVKYNGVVFADFNYNTIYGGNFGLPLHPDQNPNDISRNVWGIFSMQGTHSLLDNNPENNLLSGVAYYTPGSDGKYYFAVFGGLTYLSDSGSIPGFMRLKAAPGGAYLKVYEVDAADAGVYDAAVLSGPNVPGKGAFGTFGTQIINAPSATLWLDAVFSPGTMIYYDGAFQAGELELLTQNSSITGSAEAYLDVIGGTADSHIKKGVFPIAFPNAPYRADLKAISDLTANVRSGAWIGQWTSSAQDPITGVFQEPSCCIDIEKYVSVDPPENPIWHDADTCGEVPVQLAPHNAMYKLVVTNCGNTALTNVTITDSTLGINQPIANLAAGEVRELKGTEIPELGWKERCTTTTTIENTAKVEATCSDPAQTSVSDQDSACWQCTLQICGDGIVGNTPGETCDPPGSVPNTSYPNNTCRDNCTYCGDGIKNNGEQCDFNDPNASVFCNTDCTLQQFGGCRMTGGHNTVAPDGSYYVVPGGSEVIRSVVSSGKKTTTSTTTTFKYTVGGQIGAPEAGCCTPGVDCAPGNGGYGEWEHSHHENGTLKFSFHAGTHSAPPDSYIQCITCTDPGWCVQARCAPFKQIFWEGTGVFQNPNQKNDSPFKLSGCTIDPNAGKTHTLHYYKAHVGDFGEPGNTGKQKSWDPNVCHWTSGGVEVENTVLMTPQPPVPDPKFGDKGGQSCDACPDWYEIEVHCTANPSSPIIYRAAGYLTGGNHQLHPEVGQQCPF
ncbi:MAG: hypothetical protein Q8N09_04670 [Thermodesulfovibrionia bacterium]|nr:hypothetical protein [Thermodesulfovibrionia bacterium]